MIQTCNFCGATSTNIFVRGKDDVFICAKCVRKAFVTVTLEEARAGFAKDLEVLHEQLKVKDAELFALHELLGPVVRKLTTKALRDQPTGLEEEAAEEGDLSDD